VNKTISSIIALHKNETERRVFISEDNSIIVMDYDNIWIYNSDGESKLSGALSILEEVIDCEELLVHYDGYNNGITTIIDKVNGKYIKIFKTKYGLDRDITLRSRLIEKSTDTLAIRYNNTNIIVDVTSTSVAGSITYDGTVTFYDEEEKEFIFSITVESPYCDTVWLQSEQDGIYMYCNTELHIDGVTISKIRVAGYTASETIKIIENIQVTVDIRLLEFERVRITDNEVDKMIFGRYDKEEKLMERFEIIEV
jgi:outer membrane lipoprotein-sorting protein